MRSSYLVALAGTAVALALAASCAWLPPARAQDVPGPGPAVGLGSLPGDNAPGFGGAASPRVRGVSTLHVTITILPTCSVDRGPELIFPSPAAGERVVDGAGSIDIDCTKDLPYLLALDAGGAVPAAPYRLYSDPGRQSVWGDRAGIDTVPGSGTGAPVTVPVYGRAPAASHAAGAGGPVRFTVAY
jgi:spore coat protein U-like protein